MNIQGTTTPAPLTNSGRTTRRRACSIGLAGAMGAIALAACGGQSASMTPQKKDVELSIIQQPTFSTELDNQVYPAGYDLFREQTGIRVPWLRDRIAVFQRRIVFAL